MVPDEAGHRTIGIARYASSPSIGVASQPGLEQRLAVDHLHRRPDQDAGAEVDDARIAIDDLEHHRAAPDDDRYADHQAGHHQQVAAVRGAGDGQHVVEAHHRVGDDDRAHRAPEGRWRRAVRVAGIGVGQQQPVGDPEQQRAAGEQQARESGSSQTTITVIRLRTPIAPTAPQTIARFCSAAGRLRAARAMTMALSPARTRSMTTIASKAERKAAGSIGGRGRRRCGRGSILRSGGAAIGRESRSIANHDRSDRVR